MLLAIKNPQGVPPFLKEKALQKQVKASSLVKKKTLLKRNLTKREIQKELRIKEHPKADFSKISQRVGRENLPLAKSLPIGRRKELLEIPQIALKKRIAEEEKSLEVNSTSPALVQPVAKNPDSRKGSMQSPLPSRKTKEGDPIFRRTILRLLLEKSAYTKGRGKDQKPIYGVEPKPFNSEAPTEKRGFGKNRSKFVELNAERPDYNFDSLPQKKNKKEGEELIRLNKYVANSGICSRREADDLIQKGLVVVNGVVVQEMGYKVKKSDHVVFQGKKINPEKPVYVLLNKPKDFITTTEDPMERKTVMKLVENACEERIFPVGRLDRNTTGLLVFTNDGELAAKLSHPSNEIKKIYQVTLDKPLTAKDEEEITEGLTLEDGDAKVDDLQVLSKDRTILGLEIHIGRNRIVRRIFAHLGYEVVALDRVMYAGLDKKDLKRGHYRFLTEQEVIRLKYYI